MKLRSWIKLKKIVINSIGSFGFFRIMLFASIPNPLFDLAGLTCGHLLVPFWTFFGATLIGKAVNKTLIQSIFVLTAFSKDHLEALINFIESLIPPLKGMLSTFFEEQRKKNFTYMDQQIQLKNNLGYLLEYFGIYF